MQPGDAVGVRWVGAWWTPWRLVSHDANGLVVAGVLDTQPRRCLFLSDTAAVEMIPAADAVFSFPCMTCKRDGCVPAWVRRKFAGPEAEELMGGATYERYKLVECPVCDGAREIVWDPFRERPTCVRPDRQRPVAA